MTFAMPGHLLEELRKDGRGFFCPMGHNLAYTDGENERLKRELVQERQKHDQTQAALRERDRLLALERAELAKHKQRTANGVCPCCKRAFVQLQRHMKTKHPDYPTAKTVKVKA